MGQTVRSLVLDADVEAVHDVRETRTTEEEFARLVEVGECPTQHARKDPYTSVTRCASEQHRHDSESARPVDDGSREVTRSRFTLHPAEVRRHVQHGVRNEPSDESLGRCPGVATEDSPEGDVGGDEHEADTVQVRGLPGSEMPHYRVRSVLRVWARQRRLLASDDLEMPVLRSQSTCRTRSISIPEAFPLSRLPGDHDGGVASGRDMRRSAETLRKIAEVTQRLPGDSPADARLQDHLELAADVLDATVEAEPEGLRVGS